MIKLPFLRSVVVALLISGATAVLYLSLSLIFDKVTALQACTSAATLAYVLYLLGQSDTRFGRVSTVGIFLACTFLAWLLTPSTLLLAAFNVGVIWLVRAVYYHNNVLVALADLVISVITFTAAIAAALQSNSLFLALWSFFLAQAMIVPILNYISNRVSGGENGNRDRDCLSAQHDAMQQNFQHAYRNAENALRRLADAS